jgi:hypothetical protein
VITFDQLKDFGFSVKAIRHWIDRGRIVAEWPGIYRVGQMPLTREGRFMAAVLACGEDAALSHESAGALWGICKGGFDPIHVSVPADRRVRLKGPAPP